MLGVDDLAGQLDAGVAPHHAGMVPAFKEVVEQCFTAGLLGAVFATETLAVGVNMPARTVVIEKLTKFTGDHHELLTPGEYTQLTGRAGRRGIDEVGQAVVLWSPFLAFDRVAALASSRSFNLRSAFRPTYNMAANLVRTYTSEQAHHLLNLSFAQYQADRDVVRLEARAERLRASIVAGRADAESSYGDIWEYRAERAAERTEDGRSARESALSRLRPGDVVRVSRGRYRGPAVMVAERVTQGWNASDGDLRRRRVAARHRRRRDRPGRSDRQGPPPWHVPAEGPPVPPRRRQAPRQDVPAPGSGDRRRAPTRQGIHPVELDPDLRQRMRAAAQVERLERELAEIDTRVDRHNRSLSREFDRVVGVLEHRGYLDEPADGWALTAKGTMLASVFHECDLLITECLGVGLLDDVDAPVLAGLLSVFVHEHRSPEPPAPPWFPDATARQRWLRIVAVSEDLSAEERAAGWEHTGPPIRGSSPRPTGGRPGTR